MQLRCSLLFIYWLPESTLVLQCPNIDPHRRSKLQKLYCSISLWLKLRKEKDREKKEPNKNSEIPQTHKSQSHLSILELSRI